MARVLIQALGVVLLAGLPLLANAQLSGNISLTTNYKFRGQDQDLSKNKAVKPAIQGGFDYAFGDSGFYVGNWNSSVDWLTNNSIEMDFYGGYKFKAGSLGMDVGALMYAYPGNSAGNTTELYVSAAYGPLTAKYSHTVSKDYFAYAGNKVTGLKGTNTGYFNVSYAQEVIPKVTLKAALGFTQFSSDIKNAGVPNFMDYSVGAAYDFGDGLSLGGAFVGANKKNFYGDVNKSRLIVTLTKAL